jgi:signal transduction histidine kinase
MTIRARLTLWYGVVFFLSTLIIGAVAYWEFVIERRAEVTAGEAPGPVMEDLGEIGLRFGLPSALLGLLGGWFLMRRALAPVAALAEAVGRVTEHHLRESLPRSRNGDELDRLTEVFNAMISRLDGSFQRIREFTLHASHELKTPLTVLHGELEAAVRDSNMSEAHRARCETQLAEVQRLVQMVDGLSLLTKADAGLVVLARESVRLDELLRDAFADAQILAQPRSLKVLLEVCEPLTVVGDRNRLRQVLLNLTDNAIKYNKQGGEVVFALRRADAWAELTVTNTGPGMPPEVQTRVFDRFFRGDPSHNSDIEGCGLGLSIAQWIVSTHAGTIEIRSKPGDPTKVVVRLPIKS